MLNPALIARRRRAGGADPFLALFADGTDGFDYDMAKTNQVLSTGANGGYAVATEEEPIGWLVDQHKFIGQTFNEYLSDQSDLVANGGFDDTSGWLQTSDGALPDPISGGVALVQRNGAGERATVRQETTVETSADYVLSFEASSVVSSVAITISTAQFGGGTVLGTHTINRNGVYYVFFTSDASLTSAWLYFSSNVLSSSAEIDNVSMLKVVGFNHAKQSSNILRPEFVESGAYLPSLTTSHLTTSVVPDGAGNTIIIQASVPPTLAALRVLAGTKDASGGGFGIGINTSGNVVGWVGNDDETAIVGTSDVRGSAITAQLVANGTTVTLYVNGSPEYTGAQDGIPSTTNPIYLSAMNANGSPANYGQLIPVLRATFVKKAV